MSRRGTGLTNNPNGPNPKWRVNTCMMTPPESPRGHPLRRSLPAPRIVSVSNDDSDLKLFALSFTAFFVCFYTFLI